MTVSSTTRKAGPFAGNGVTTVFPFTFKVFAKTDIQLTRTDANGAVSTLALDSDYSVTLNVDQDSSPGGRIMYPITGAPLPAGATLIGIGDLPYTQPTDITNNGGFYPSVVEGMSDRSTIQIQQLAELSTRSLHFPVSEDNVAGEFPTAGTRAGTMFGFDANGNPTYLPLPASVGAGDMRFDTFISDQLPNPMGLPTFTAGLTTSITLSRAPLNKANCWIYWDATEQLDFTVTGAVLGFPAAIFAGVNYVYARTGTTLSLNTPAQSSVTDASISPGSKLYNRTIDMPDMRDWGVRADGMNSDTASANAALAWLAANGGTMLAPPGKIMLDGTGLLLDQSTLTDNLLTHGCLQGSGQGATEFFYSGTGSALTYKGAPPPFANAYCTFEKFRLLGASQSAGVGMFIKDASLLKLRDVVIQVFGTGLIGTDVLQSSFDNVAIGANGGGMQMFYTNFTQPNANVFNGCHFISNLNYGVNLGDPSTCVFIGGSVQENGVGGSAVDRYGVGVFTNISTPSLAGSAAASFFGTYFEGNQGHADIWFTAGNGTDGDSSLLAAACTFNRLSNTSQVVNNIRADIGAANKVQLTILGNGFNGFGGYVPSSGTPYVAVNPSGGSVYDVTDLGNMYGANAEKPVYIGPAKTGAGMASAYCTFDGTQANPIPQNKYNVTSITKIGVGDYSISFEKSGPKANYPVSIDMNGIGFRLIFSPAQANVRIQTYNASQVLTDFAFISVTCFGNGDVT